MEPITTTAIVLYVADKIAEHIIQEDIWLRIKNCIFSTKNEYRSRLQTIILDTIEEYERLHPYDKAQNKIPFYKYAKTFDVLSRHILFKTQTHSLVVAEFESDSRVSVPTQKEIEDFYSFFIERVRADKKLRKIHIEENYKKEIFEISSLLNKVLSTTEAVKKDTEKILSHFDKIRPDIQAIQEKYGADIAIHTQFFVGNPDVIPIIEQFSPRKELMNDLLSDLKQYPWVTLNGNIGMGKTQLAALAAMNYDGTTFWISLRGVNEKSYFFKILHTLASALNVSSYKDINALIGLVMNALPVNCLIVLDDLPKLDGQSQPDIFFITLIKALSGKEVHVLSTSNKEIPGRVKELLPNGILFQKSIPPLSEEEVQEILKSYGCPDELSESLKSLVKSISMGHPTITTAIARFLTDKAWKFTGEEMLSLFRGDYSTDLVERVYADIDKTINDASTKELIHRLSIIIGSFTEQDVRRISDVVPVINSPIERLIALLGLWIQKESKNTYQVSPLVQRLKAKNLSVAVEQQVNLVLGKAILDKRTLDQFDASKAISYFIAGKDVNKAGFVLMMILNSALDDPKLFYDYGFDAFWYSSALPGNMDLFLQMYIRVFQLSIAIKQKEDVEYLKEDLEKTIKKAGPKGINVGSAAMLLATIYSTTNPTTANSYFLLGLKSFEELNRIEAFQREFNDDFLPEQLLWSTAFGVKSREALLDWFETLDKLTVDQRRRIMEVEGSDLGCLVIGHHLYQDELKKPADSRNWHYLIETLNVMQENAARLQLPLMTANAVRFKINVLSEQLNDITEALRVANETLSQFKDNTSEAFLINDAIGRQLFYKNRNKEALHYVATAAAIEVNPFYTEKLDTYLVISQLLGEQDNKTALYYSAQAYSFAVGNENFDQVLQAKVIGEYAISLYLAGELKEAIYKFGQSFEILLDSYDNTIEYKGSIVRVGHVLNYVYSILTKSAPPEKDINGEDYLPPARGMFLKTNGDLANAYYFEGRKFMVAHLMLNCFEAIEDLDNSVKWALKNIELSNALPFNVFYPVLQETFGYIIINGQYGEAIRIARRIIDMTNTLADSKEDISEFAEIDQIKKIIKDRPRAKIHHADDYIIRTTVAPAVLKIGTLYVSDIERAKEELNSFLGELASLDRVFDSPDIVSRINAILSELLKEEPNGEALINMVNNYTDDAASSLKLVGYLASSLIAPTSEAIKIHFAIIEVLEQNLKGLSKGAYLFIALPFFEAFWLKRFETHPRDFIGHELWINKGIPRFQNAKPNEKLKKLFLVLTHHLDYEPTTRQEEWMEK